MPKNGGLGQFVDLREVGKKQGVVFLIGMGLIPQCPLWAYSVFTFYIVKKFDKVLKSVS